MEMRRRGFLGRFLALAPAATAVAVPAVAATKDRPVGRAGLVVVRVDDSTMAKIEAGPGGGVSNGYGARYFDGGVGVPVPDDVRALRQRFVAQWSRAPRQTPVGLVSLPGARS